MVALFWADVDTRSSSTIYYRWVHYILQVSALYTTGECTIYYKWVHYILQVSALYTTGECTIYYRWVHPILQVSALYATGECTIYYKWAALYPTWWAPYILQVSVLYITRECTIYYRWVHYILQVNSHTPTAFPIAANPVVAPFWAEVDTRSSSTIYYRWVHYILQVSALYITGECTIYYKWVHYILQVSALYITGECTIYYKWVHYILQVSVLYTTGECTVYYRWVHSILQVSALYITGELHYTLQVPVPIPAIPRRWAPYLGRRRHALQRHYISQVSYYTPTPFLIASEPFWADVDTPSLSPAALYTTGECTIYYRWVHYILHVSALYITGDSTIYYRWAPTRPPPSPSPPTPWWRPSGPTSTRAPASLYITGEWAPTYCRWPHYIFQVSRTIPYKWVAPYLKGRRYYTLQIQRHYLLTGRVQLYIAGECTIYYRWVHDILQVSALNTAGESTIYYRWVHYILHVSVLCITGKCTIYYMWMHYIL